MSQDLRPYTMLAADIEHYSERKEIVQRALREALHRRIELALDESGVVPAECEVYERGDALIVLAPPTVAPTVLVTTTMARLVDHLRQQAALNNEDARMRLRVSLHAGYATRDPYGHVGDAINQTARLLDCQPLRVALAKTPTANAAVILSDLLYQTVIAPGHADGSGYVRVDVSVKTYRGVGWLSVPGHPVPIELTQIPGPAKAVPPPEGKTDKRFVPSPSAGQGAVHITAGRDVVGRDSMNIHYGSGSYDSGAVI